MAYTTIKKPSDYFNTVLYTGNGTAIGSGGNAITGVGFQPDWTWIKDRTSVNNHNVFDVVRGVTKGLQTSSTIAEYTNTETLSTFDTDGFTVGNSGGLNTNSNNYVSWNWLADNTSGSSNTDGSITSTISANTTSGFSIVSYTGTGSNATVGHGLGVAPKMVIIKNRTTSAQNWQCYHSALGGTKAIELNTTSASYTDSTRFNNTDPTSSVFSIGTATDVNTSSASIIAYCFAEKKGFSKFGSYTGNGSTDGPFIYTGFKPAFLITRRTDSLSNWPIHDTQRSPFNVTEATVYANASDAEVNPSTEDVDFLSNGFKLRSTTGARNSSGGNYIYMAFAEEPLVGDNPATAR
jgi:hypothetical protein